MKSVSYIWLWSELNSCRVVIDSAGKILFHTKLGLHVQAYISVPDDLAVPGASRPLDCLQVVHAPCLLCGSFSAVGNREHWCAN